MRKLGGVLAVSCIAFGAGVASPVLADFTGEQMTAMLGAAEGLGLGEAIGEACGTDMSKMNGLVVRGWKCQGASAEQLVKLTAAVATSRQGNKAPSCPLDKAAHAKQIAESTAQLEQGLTKINCKG